MQNAETRSRATGSHPPGELVLDRYRLVRRLGSGGFGVVWLAHDERLDRAVAVKRIGVDDPAVAKRAEREAKAAARLSHAGIVALYEAGRDDDAVYLVSELVRGRTLARLMAEGELSDRDVVEIGIALCAALAHAHGRGVVHRDVKPGNVIVPDPMHDDGRAHPAKLTDFGIAQLLGEDALTRTGDVVGTLAYMAPEQAEGREVTAAADLYALALVLYEALTGLNPVRGRTPASTARRVGVRLPALGRVRRDLPLELCAAIDRAVAPRPEDRGRLGDLRGALKAALHDVGEEAGTVGAGPLETVTRVTRAVRTHAAAPPRADGAWGRDALVPDEAAAPRRPPAPPSTRALAALGAGALAAAALEWLGPDPALAPLAGGLIAAGAVAVLPRLGWIAVAAALVAWLLTPGARFGGLAVLVACAALPTAPALWRARPSWWSAPALAPLLGAIAAAGAWPALAGQAARASQRAALGALGCWWLMLAEALTGRTLLLGPAPGVDGRLTWETSAGDAFAHAIGPLLSGGALAVGAVWALGAAVLPLLVRGRSAAVDLVLATAWAAGLAAATQAIAGALLWDGRAPEPRGVVAGAVAAGILAVGARASRGTA